MSALVIWPGPEAVRARVGGKAASLNALADAGLEPPRWCAVTPQAFDASVSPQQAEAIIAGDADALDGLKLAEDVAAAISMAARTLSPDGAPIAVRSSAVDEDGAASSFAGQLDSFLNVPLNEVAERIADVWRSGFSARIRAYRDERRLGPPSPPAVILQRMAKASAAGVAFSVDPVSGDADVAVVAAVRGLGDRLVSGEETGDAYRVDQAGALIDARLDSETAVLSPEQAGEIAELARRAEAHFGSPQDIEWAYADGKAVLLQSRPITTLTLGGLTRILWDNSNIVESYPGVTTPLTFTFARRAYSAVYKELASVLGVSAKRIQSETRVFDNMIGLADGRIYYNLLNWYRALALLPGFALNRKAMEQMMGVDQALPPSLAAEAAKRPQAGFFGRMADGAALATTATKLLAKRIGLKRAVNRFHARVDAALAESPDLTKVSYDRLTADYRRLEEILLTGWTPPLVNDLCCMAAFGAAKRLSGKWADDADGAHLNSALVGRGGVISAEPARRIMEMGRMVAAADDSLAEALISDHPERARAAIAAYPEIAAALDTYLERFGDRCMAELKLESETLNDDPTTLYRAIEAASRSAPEVPEAAIERANDPLDALAARVDGRFKRFLVKRAAREAAARIRDRENMRFERTRVFGRVRRLFLEMGARLAAAGKLDEPRDVFFLTFDETIEAGDGGHPNEPLKELAAARAAAFERFTHAAPPPRRFESVGAIGLGLRAPVPAQTQQSEADDPTTRTGLGCCPGVVRGRARVVRDPKGVTLDPGDILVAEFTDPGWVTLFAQASALVVERGSMLSHSAIVAREIGLPAVVGLADACAWITDGEEIEIDGSAGIVRRIAAT